MADTYNATTTIARAAGFRRAYNVARDEGTAYAEAPRPTTGWLYPSWRGVPGPPGAPGLDTLYGEPLGTVGEIVPWRHRLVSNTIGSLAGVVHLQYFQASRTETITTLTTFTGTTAAAATPTLCRMGTYTVADNGDLNLAAATANKPALWSTANATCPDTLITPWNKTAGLWYATALLCVTAAAAPNFHGAPMAGTSIINTLVRTSPVTVGRLAGQTDLPDHISAASLVGFQAVIAVHMS